MTLEQARAEVSAWTRDGAVKCICGNNDLRSRIKTDPDSGEVREIHIYCPQCSETVFKKTIEKNQVSEFSRTGG